MLGLCIAVGLFRMQCYLFVSQGKIIASVKFTD